MTAVARSRAAAGALPATSNTALVREFRAMNTDWWISACGGADLEAAERRVHEAESLFSRFRPDSLLSRLNRERRMRDQRLASLIARALELQRLTEGAFDPRVGPALEAAGYDRSFELLDARSAGPEGAPSIAHLAMALLSIERLSVEISGDEVRLVGDGAIDLGGIAKGWTVDCIARELEDSGCHNYVVDGGGDIRAAGVGEHGEPWAIGVGDGHTLRLRDRAVCTSSTARRRWRTVDGEAHHIIDPRSGAPALDAASTAVVLADDAATADALATALLVDRPRGLRAAARLGADVLFEDSGRWELTAGMERWLR